MTDTGAEASRSPIKDRPLRHAGQSLEQQRRDLVLDGLLPHLMLATLVVLVLVLEWWRFLNPAQLNPIPATLLAVPYIGFVAWRFHRLKPKLKAIQQGIDGERAVGQFLERTRESGYVVFHDILGNDFNIDHVLIGPAGVFTIETKTWSKPARGEARIRFDGEHLSAGNHAPDRDPIVQARAQASWLKNKLLESAGKKFEVFPVVVFPGWFVEHTEGALQRMWVLEPKALPAFLANEPLRLVPEDRKIATFHLSRFIRAVEAERAKAS